MVAKYKRKKKRKLEEYKKRKEEKFKTIMDKYKESVAFWETHAYI